MVYGFMYYTRLGKNYMISRIDEILIDLVKKDVKGDDVAIFMGGGTDIDALTA